MSERSILAKGLQIAVPHLRYLAHRRKAIRQSCHPAILHRGALALAPVLLTKIPVVQRRNYPIKATRQHPPTEIFLRDFPTEAVRRIIAEVFHRRTLIEISLHRLVENPHRTTLPSIDGDGRRATARWPEGGTDSRGFCRGRSFARCVTAR